MSAFYITRVYLLYEDEQAVVDKIREYVKNTSDSTVYPETEITDLMSALSVIFTNVHKTDNEIREKHYKLPEDRLYEASFYASYRWRTVMINMFDYISGVLKNGSFLYILPDDDQYFIDYLVVEDGYAERIY